MGLHGPEVHAGEGQEHHHDDGQNGVEVEGDPACEEYALRIRHMLYLDGAGFPRRILREAGIYPVPDPPQPSLLHEEEGSLWRKRADLTVSLRVREEQRGQARGSIHSAPAVILHK